MFDFFLGPLVRLPPADLYYLHSFYQYPGLAVRRLFRRAPFIYDAHDFYSTLEYESYGSKLQRKVELRVERRCVRRSAGFVTVSDGVAALYEQRFGRRPIVLRNAHDERLDQAPDETLRSTVQVSRDEFLVVLVGQWKGAATPLAEVIDAVARSVERIHVAFLGPGFPPRCRSAAIAAGVGDRVHFLPGVAPSEVVPFISDADAGAVLYRPTNPSVAACLPNGYFQVIAAGLPIVVARDLPIVASEAGAAGCVVDGSDSDSIAAGFDRLASDVDYRSHLRLAAETIRGAASWAHEETKLQALVTDVLMK